MNDDCLDCFVIMPHERVGRYKTIAELKGLPCFLLVTCGVGYRVHPLGFVAGPHDDIHRNEIVVRTERLVAPRDCYAVTARYTSKKQVSREAAMQFQMPKRRRFTAFGRRGLMEEDQRC